MALPTPYERRMQRKRQEEAARAVSSPAPEPESKIHPVVRAVNPQAANIVARIKFGEEARKILPRLASIWAIEEMYDRSSYDRLRDTESV